jgi:hypothetical protein
LNSMSMPAPQTLQQQQPMSQQLQHQSSITSNYMDSNMYNAFRASSISSVPNVVGNQVNFLSSDNMNLQQQQQTAQPPTLPPHPKQKQLPSGISLQSSMVAPPDRLNSLRGISTMSIGMSGLARGASVESSASAVLMRNSWEDKFFSMMMLGDVSDQTLSESNLSPTPIGGAPVTVTESSSIDVRELTRKSQVPQQQDDDLSDVSNSDLQ